MVMSKLITVIFIIGLILNFISTAASSSLPRKFSYHQRYYEYGIKAGPVIGLAHHEQPRRSPEVTGVSELKYIILTVVPKHLELEGIEATFDRRWPLMAKGVVLEYQQEPP